MPGLPQIRLYTDGGARGNPGPAAIGVVVCDADDRVLQEHQEFLGVATNNQAEYTAVIQGLEIARRYGHEEIRVITDSELLVRQIEGRYEVRNGEIRRLHASLRDGLRAFSRVEFEHRPRRTGRLARADDLVNEELDSRGFPKSR